MLLILLFLLNIAQWTNSKYTYKHIVKTNFVSTDSVLDAMCSKKYFDLYLQEVKADTIEYIPKMTTNKLTSRQDQKVSYECIPEVSFLPFKIPKMRIVQNWKIDNSILYGNIHTKYLDFDLIVKFVSDDTVQLEITGIVNKKMIVIPNYTLKNAIRDYENIFRNIIREFDLEII